MKAKTVDAEMRERSIWRLFRGRSNECRGLPAMPHFVSILSFNEAALSRLRYLGFVVLLIHRQMVNSGLPNFIPTENAAAVVEAFLAQAGVDLGRLR